jgi:hypothetical protein
MKLYATNTHASMSFADDPAFTEALREFVSSVDSVIETGTYLGLGSTRLLAEFFLRTALPKSFITIEANWDHFKIAKSNLCKYPFVDCRWGLSLYRADALKFIANDDAIRDHAAYPSIWIDDLRNPVAFYSAEISGQMATLKSKRPHIMLARMLAKRFASAEIKHLWCGEDLLAKFLNLHKAQGFGLPLIVLDSAGGVGYLEFEVARDIMAQREYFLLLDDTHHLKHFRSARDIRGDSNFTILAESPSAGWMLARHKAN